MINTQESYKQHSFKGNQRQKSLLHSTQYTQSQSVLPVCCTQSTSRSALFGMEKKTSLLLPTAIGPQVQPHAKSFTHAETQCFLLDTVERCVSIITCYSVVSVVCSIAIVSQCFILGLHYFVYTQSDVLYVDTHAESRRSTRSFTSQ